MTRVFSAIALFAVITMATGCSLFAPETSLAPAHPEALGIGRPICSDCHESNMKSSLKPYATFDHTDVFVASGHRFAAGRDERVCSVCHATSFCYDCHATRSEIKPATKLENRPDRELIHRGDYLTRHRFDGKIDPASCYGCHGRSNNESCVACHR